MRTRRAGSGPKSRTGASEGLRQEGAGLGSRGPIPAPGWPRSCGPAHICHGLGQRVWMGVAGDRSATEGMPSTQTSLVQLFPGPVEGACAHSPSPYLHPQFPLASSLVLAPLALGFSVSPAWSSDS